MDIYDEQNNLLLSVQVDDNSYRNRAIMGEHNLTLYYSLPEHVELPVGAYCIYEGERYTLMRPEQLKMRHTRLYEYSVVFSSEQDKAKIWKFRNTVDRRLKFPLTAKPKEHLQMFIDNMNRRDCGWTIGECIEDVEKLISYDHDYCWDALTKIADEFDTEFEFTGKTVSLKKVEYNKSNPLPLAYGKGNGFKPDIGRSNTSEALPVEILFVQGGDTNIDRSKYPVNETLRAVSNGCLLLPGGKTIAYDGEHFEDDAEFNAVAARHYQVDELGLSIRNIDKELTSMVEDSLDRSDDYPKRIGTVTGVVKIESKENHLYDIIDSTIPEELNYEDYLIGEEKMTIIFQTGELAGKEFEVKYHHKPKTINGIHKEGRRFEIVPQEIDGVMMPGGSFVPVADKDTYAVFHVMLPDSYICNDADRSGASWDMFRAAVRYLFDNEQQKFSFTGELDGIWAKKKWSEIGHRIRLGGFVKFTHDKIAPDGALIRIINIKDYINKPHSPKIELSNDTISGTVSSTLKQLASTEVVIEENHRQALQFTKRRFRDALETLEMLENAQLTNFNSAISPVAIQTMAMLVGDESLQFIMGKTIATIGSGDYSVKFEDYALTASAGYLRHMTIGVNSITATRQNSQYLTWPMPAMNLVPNDEDKLFVYAVVKREGFAYNDILGATLCNTAGEWLISKESHHIEEDPDKYYLLLGILNSEFHGERTFAPLFGFTEILPGQVATDMIISNDGKTYIDLASGEIGGRIRFLSDNGYLTIIEGGKIKTDLLDATKIVAAAFIARDANGKPLTSFNLDGDGIIRHYYPGTSTRQYESGVQNIINNDGQEIITVGRYYAEDGSLLWWLSPAGLDKPALPYTFEALKLVPSGTSGINTSQDLTASAVLYYRFCSTSNSQCEAHSSHTYSYHNGETFVSADNINPSNHIPDGTYYSPTLVGYNGGVTGGNVLATPGIIDDKVIIGYRLSYSFTNGRCAIPKLHAIYEDEDLIIKQ